MVAAINATLHALSSRRLDDVKILRLMFDSQHEEVNDVGVFLARAVD